MTTPDPAPFARPAGGPLPGAKAVFGPGYSHPPTP